MIVLFTDFGATGPYIGQLKAVLLRDAPGTPVFDLMCDVPAFNPKAAAFLLAALAGEFPEETVFLCVVDPGVGTQSRLPIVAEVDGQRFVGPGNGLFNVVAARGRRTKAWEITWRPARLSSSFHGRDLFAPVAAMIARGDPVPGTPVPVASLAAQDWPDDLAEVIYIDHFGNAVTGFRASRLTGSERLLIGESEFRYARIFGEVSVGEGFWYENSNGLVEIAVNQGNASARFGLVVGSVVTVQGSPL